MMESFLVFECFCVLPAEAHASVNIAIVREALLAGIYGNPSRKQSTYSISFAEYFTGLTFSNFITQIWI